MDRSDIVAEFVRTFRGGWALTLKIECVSLYIKKTIYRRAFKCVNIVVMNFQRLKK
jgi:hypothetical protein